MVKSCSVMVVVASMRIDLWRTLTGFQSLLERGKDV